MAEDGSDGRPATSHVAAAEQSAGGGLALRGRGRSLHRHPTAGHCTAQPAFNGEAREEDRPAQVLVDRLCTLCCRAARHAPDGSIRVHGAGPRWWRRAAKGPPRRCRAKGRALSGDAQSSAGPEGADKAHPPNYTHSTESRRAHSTEENRAASCTAFWGQGPWLAKKGCLFAPGVLDLGIGLAIL